MRKLYRVLELDPTHVDAWYYKGIIFYKLDRCEEAIECFNKVLELNFSHLDAWYYKGLAFINLKWYNEALKCFDRALKVDPKHVDSWYTKGFILYNLELYNKALECFNKTLELNPKHVDAWYYKGVIFNILGKSDKAVECFDKVLEIDSNNSQAWYNKGQALYNLERYKESLKCLNRVLKLNPKHVDAWYYKGSSLSKLKKYEEAIQCFDRALELGPNHVDALYKKGLALSKLKKYEEAIEYLDKTLELDSQHFRAWYNKGYILSNKLKKYEEAIQCFDRALELDPEDKYSWYHKGFALSKLGKYEEAIECFDRALELDPYYPLTWYNKGFALNKLGKYEEAIQCFDRALKLDPKYAYAWESKGFALSRLGKYEDAIKCFEKALEINPRYIRAWYNMGFTFSKLEVYTEAVKCFDKVLEINPRYTEAWYSKGLALSKLGRYREAVQCLNRFLSIKDDPKVRKIKEVLEEKLKRPELKIKLLNSLFVLNRWDKVKMEVLNEGEVVAREITFKFSDEITVRNLPKVEVKPKSKEIVEFYLKPNALGEVPVEVEIRCKDHLNKKYKFKETVTIEVEEEVGDTTIRKGTTPTGSTVRQTTLRAFPPELREKYVEVEYIGKGGFARVFKAKRKDGKEVAVKIPISLDESVGKSFIKELTNWTRLKHKNIVKIYDYNILPVPYFEMELCDHSLADLEKPLDLEKAGWLIFNIAEGLKYADLKPQNVLIKDGIPKISDWGLSKIMTESTSTTTDRCYTPLYASPEQIKGESKDERTDIWQLGVIFYELVTGELPFKGDSFHEIAISILTKEPVKPSEINPEAKEVEDIILKCLEKDKEKRYQSVEELQKDLAKYLVQGVFKVRCY